MTNLTMGKRVTVTAEPLVGKSGTVVRPCMSDDSAWVRMDDDLPSEIQTFTDEQRKRHIRLSPEDCEAL